MPARKKTSSSDSTANLGFEAKLWLAADKLRNNMDAAEYKHVVLGLIFLKYISDSFEEHHAKLLAGSAGASPAGSGALAASSSDNPYAGANPEGSPKGWRGGANQFYTPSCVVRLLVEMLAPYKGRIYDPACSSGGMFASLRRPCGMRFARRKRASTKGIVQSEKFMESHGGGAKCEVRSAIAEVETSRSFVVRNSSFVTPPGPEHADTCRRDLEMANAEVRMSN
jgi:hypothetical protein